ncbi:MAG TPA: hypothetical protein VFG73_02215 [Rhodanobacteraceae bacterium]|nr:hypothetical protein [Rhodanobacteraceae bacterium]
MKIVSLIKPRHADVRHVTVHGTQYSFTRQGDGTYVADVHDARAVKCLLANRHFAQYGVSALKREPVPAAPVDTPPAGEGAAGDAAGTGEGDTEAPERGPLEAEAAGLLEGNASVIGKAIGNVSSLAVLRVAVEMEAAEGGKQRKNVLDLLNGALEGAAQSGLTE